MLKWFTTSVDCCPVAEASATGGSSEGIELAAILYTVLRSLTIPSNNLSVSCPTSSLLLCSNIFYSSRLVCLRKRINHEKMNKGLGSGPAPHVLPLMQHVWYLKSGSSSCSCDSKLKVDQEHFDELIEKVSAVLDVVIVRCRVGLSKSSMQSEEGGEPDEEILSTYKRVPIVFFKLYVQVR